MPNQGFGALAEFALGEHADDAPETVAIAGSDGLAPLLADASAVLAALARADALAVTVAGALAGLAVAVVRDDGVLLALTGTAQIVAALARGDDVLVALDDVSAVAVSQLRTDSLAVDLGEGVVLPIVVTLERTDQVLLTTERLARGAMFGAMAEFAMAEHYRDRNGEALIRERVQIFARLSRADAAVVQIAATPELLSALSRADQAAARIDETDARAEERLHRRIINVISY